MDIGVDLGHVLVGEGEVESVFAGFGKNFDKRAGGEVLEFVNVKIKVFSLFFGNVDAVHGGLLDFGDDHGAEEGGVVFTEFALREVDEEDFTFFKHFF